MKKFLLRKLTLAFKLFLISVCFFNSAETFAQGIVIRPIGIKPPSTTTITSSANPSIVGQPVLLTATITSVAQGTPTGTVHFFDNTTNTDLTPGGVAISNGMATFTTAVLTVNASFTANYSGDDANLPSTSVAFAQTVNQPVILITPVFNTTTTTLVSNLNPSVAGSQAVTLTATIGSSLDANLTGKVDFYDNTDNKDLTPGGVAVSGGVATFTTSSLDFGDLNIKASYSGDANGNQSSTSSSLIQHVLLNISGLGITITSSQNPMTWGGFITFTATVSAGVDVSAGAVVFTDNGNLLGSATTDASGKAILKTSLLTPGSHSITASFFSISSGLIQNITPAYPTIFVGQGTGNNHSNVGIISSAQTAVNYGETITFEANVLGDGINIPTGNISFMDGSDPQSPTLLETVGLDGAGNGTFTTSILSVGTHKIYAVYSGNDIYLEDSSNASNQVNTKHNIDDYVSEFIVQAPTSTSISSSLNPSVAGQQITFTATVASPFPESNAIAPGGTVIFNIDGIDQDPAPLNGNGVKAFLDISSLSPSSHTVKATYLGDGNYKASSSGSITQVVEPVGSAIFDFLGSSQSTLVNTFFPNGLMFDIIDINPKLVGGATVTFTAPSSGPSGTFSNGTNTITVHTTALGVGAVGVANSGPFKANGIAGSYTVTASIPGLGSDNFTMTNTAPTIPITVGTSVAGLSFTVDGSTFTGTQIFNWVPGTSHSLSTTSPQAGLSGTQYVFTGWSDATNTLSDNITVPSTATSYTANFSTQYQLTITANPSNGGTLSPASATFYNAGDVVQLTATANPGYAFTDWTGNVANTNAVSTSVTMSAPQNVTANFNQLPVTIQITVGTSVPGLSFMVDGTTYTSEQILNWFPGDIHSLSTSATQAGSPGTQYVFTNWSNGGGALVSAPSTATTYTANFKTQYQLTTISNAAPGSSGSVTPVSGSFYDAGSLIGVQANPDAGSIFSVFTGDLTGTGNPQILGMNGPKTVTAGFAVDCQPTTWLFDGDNDGYYSGEYIGLASCTSPGPGWKPYSEFTKGVDCDDNDPAITVGQVWYKDADNDGYSDGTTKTQCGRPTGYKLAPELTATSGDCNDNDKTIYPGAPELCDGKDNNCNGQVDEGGSSTYYHDGDGDGYGDPNMSTTACTPPTGYVSNNTDCNDNDKTIYPGAPELCDGKDNNCNGQIDEGVKTTWYRDADGDGYGNPSMSTTACAPPTGYVNNNTDCNDNDKNVHSSQTYYLDADKDGYGNPAKTTSACSSTPPAGYVKDNTDCNDNDRTVHSSQTYYLDADKDGYGNPAKPTTVCSSTQPAGYVKDNTDCNDNDKKVHSGQTYYLDADKDGYGDPAKPITVCSSTQPAGYVRDNTDCNDNDKNIHSAKLFYVDADRDGYGSKTTALLCSSQAPTGYSTNNNDCDDNNAAVHPGAAEICGNAKDDNCNGLVDEGCIVCQNATTLTTTNITTSAAKLNWTAPGNPLGWEVDYKKSTASSWISLLLPGTGRSITTSSLSSNQTYNWRIRALCGKSWTSYSATINFKTLSANTATVTLAQSLPEENLSSSAGLKLYPNPNNGQFVIRLSVSNEPDGNAKIQMIDVLGRIVHTENANLSSGKLEKTVTMPSQVTRGVYMLRIIVNDKAYQTKLIYQ